MAIYKRQSYLTVFLLLFMFAPAFSRPDLSAQVQDDFARFEQLALNELAETNTPGGAIAIIRDDRIVFAKGFGVSSIETGAAATPDMLFRVGSVTKMFTATTLLLLAEQGKLKLDEPIGSYMKGLNPKLARATTYQLLSHTAGIVDRVVDYGPPDEAAPKSIIPTWGEDYILSEPGRFFSYANPGYAIAGLIAAERAGRAFADLVNDLVFKPVGMSRTTFRPTMAMTWPLAQGHNSYGNARPSVARPFANNSVYWPDGFVFSSVNELARFALAVMHGGKVDGKQVLPASVIARLVTPYVDTISLYENAKYGQGFFIRDYRGVRVFEHGGAINGFGCLLRIAPDQRLAVVGVANKTDEAMDKTIDKIFEHYLPTVRAAPSESPQNLTISESQMKEITGLYQSPSLRVELLLREGKLFYKQGSNEQEIRKIGEHDYVVELSGQGRQRRFSLLPGAHGRTEFLHVSGRALKKVEQAK
jgi:CubicO group peptidase (beta-lactamase class C family)